jgi:creatinine amidohydrolase/Fe(II)-dependent formamide hydrolase-like protein
MKRYAIVTALGLLVASSGGVAGQQQAGQQGQIELPSRYIEELTWTEVRDALAAGYTTAIIPTGGTERNGPHMVMGKHNYIITYASGIVAERLGNALVAPTIAWVPEGGFDNPQPGTISAPTAFPLLMEAAARSLKVHGFRDILIVGDNGGNQNGIRAVATKLNTEWAGSGVTVYPLTDYYDRGQDYTRIWLQAQYGYEMSEIGTHAGITDTSAMMYVFPNGVRRDKLVENPGDGVSGNPTRARADIGNMVVNFKVLATLAQYDELKSAASGGGRGGRGGGRGGGAGGAPAGRGGGPGGF